MNRRDILKKLTVLATGGLITGTVIAEIKKPIKPSELHIGDKICREVDGGLIVEHKKDSEANRLKEKKPKEWCKVKTSSGEYVHVKLRRIRYSWFISKKYMKD